VRGGRAGSEGSTTEKKKKIIFHLNLASIAQPTSPEGGYNYNYETTLKQQKKLEEKERKKEKKEEQERKKEQKKKQKEAKKLLALRKSLPLPLPHPSGSQASSTQEEKSFPHDNNSHIHNSSNEDLRPPTFRVSRTKQQQEQKFRYSGFYQSVLTKKWCRKQPWSLLEKEEEWTRQQQASDVFRLPLPVFIEVLRLLPLHSLVLLSLTCKACKWVVDNAPIWSNPILSEHEQNNLNMDQYVCLTGIMAFVFYIFS
jgi:hypothetical protein